MQRRSFFGALAALIAAPKALFAEPKRELIGTDPRAFDGLQIGKQRHNAIERYERIKIALHDERTASCVLEKSANGRDWIWWETKFVPRPFIGAVKFAGSEQFWQVGC